MASPLITVLLTTYNRCTLLGRAVDSLTRGTYANFELIILDDASTDGTQEYAKGLRDPRIQYVRMPQNGGVLRSRNRGFDLASGEIVTILDDDDELEPEALEIIAREFQLPGREDVDILWFNCVDAESRQISGNMPLPDGPLPYDAYLGGRISGDFWMAFRAPTIAKYRFDERLKAHESLLWLRMHRDHKAWFSSKVVCRKYREHGGPRLCDIDVRMQQLEHTTLAMAQYVKEFGNDVARLSPELLGAKLAYLGLHQMAIADFAAGRRSVLASLRYRFSLKYLALLPASYFVTPSVIRSALRRMESATT
jgi:glycosyltransferase involved in cell wall biosynthesis